MLRPGRLARGVPRPAGARPVARPAPGPGVAPPLSSGQFLSVFLRQLAESEAGHRHELETKLRTSLDAAAVPEGVAERREVNVELAGHRDTVELAIGDSGPGWTGGVPTDVPLTTTKRGGTGMGLHVVRTAVQNHGGTVTFGRSRLGGAEVRLRFPRAARAAASAPGP